MNMARIYEITVEERTRIKISVEADSRKEALRKFRQGDTSYSYGEKIIGRKILAIREEG